MLKLLKSCFTSTETVGLLETGAQDGHLDFHTAPEFSGRYVASTVLLILQAPVYDILPSTTAVFSYSIGSRKLSANKQFFFVGAQVVVSLLQTTQITSDVCFVTDHDAYASSNKTKIETELLFYPGVDASHVYVGAWALGCFQSY